LSAAEAATTNTATTHAQAHRHQSPRRAARARLHEHIRANGHTLHGKHHEIYLGDPRKTAPEKLRTVLRQPFR
jgi:hypothetical protein